MIEKYICNKINGNKMSSYLEMLFDIQFSNILFKIRGGDKKLPILPFTSTCIPGMKISVSIDGRYDICEKINGTMSIGDIKKGFNINKISDIVKNYNKNVSSECYKCPINRQCSMCFAFACADGRFEKPNCQEIIASYKMCLSIIYTILEENPHAYDDFLFKDEWVLNS